METIVVNLFGGPGACKSIFCASIFAELKWSSVECEMALEYAKDRVWEGSLNVLDNQLYVFGKQQHRIFRLNGKVEVIVTDSPLLNSIVYDAGNDIELRKVIFNEHCKYETINFFLDRNFKYDPKGRMQTEEGAKKLDKEILNMLDDYKVSYKRILADKTNLGIMVNEVLKKINGRLEEKKSK